MFHFCIRKYDTVKDLFHFKAKFQGNKMFYYSNFNKNVIYNFHCTYLSYSCLHCTFYSEGTFSPIISSTFIVSSASSGTGLFPVSALTRLNVAPSSRTCFFMSLQVQKPIKMYVIQMFKYLNKIAISWLAEIWNINVSSPYVSPLFDSFVGVLCLLIIVLGPSTTRTESSDSGAWIIAVGEISISYLYQILDLAWVFLVDRKI